MKPSPPNTTTRVGFVERHPLALTGERLARFLRARAYPTPAAASRSKGAGLFRHVSPPRVSPPENAAYPRCSARGSP